MKESKFNIYAENKRIVFNTLTGALACIDDEYFSVIEDINVNKSNDIKIHETTKQLMYQNGFIVNEECNELKKLMDFRTRQKVNKQILNLTIVPTMACNFDCPYCFETHKNEFMSENIMNKVLELFIKKLNHSELKIVNITWFGGEPLLALNIIKYLSLKFIEICEEKHIKFRASMVTNGYLINETVVKIFNECKINSVQITIDGTKKQHDNRRKLKGNSCLGTYDTIINNVNLLNASKIPVSLRVNIDKFNHCNLNEIAYDFGCRIINKELTRVYLGHIFKYEENEKNSCINCLSKEEYGQDKLKFANYCMENGFKNALKVVHPKLKGNYCASVTDNSMVIGSDGGIFKCWNDIGNKQMRIGNLFEEISIVEQQNAISWQQYNVKDLKECADCKILPLCAGGCPREVLRNHKRQRCEDIKYTIKDWMKLYIKYKDIE